MKFPASYWIQQAAFFGFIGILSYIPATAISEMIADGANCRALSVTACNGIQLLGLLFGMSTLMLLFVGAILIPGTLIGLVRVYPKQATFAESAKLHSQKMLLIVVSFLTWASIATLSGLLMRLGENL